MKRVYEDLLREHFSNERQMAFFAGPRQVGKTTLIKSLCGDGDMCFNWDRSDDRRNILKGSDFIVEACGLTDLRSSDSRPLIAFDEIHKFRQWKIFLKGFFDASEESASVLVTGRSCKWGRSVILVVEFFHEPRKSSQKAEDRDQA